LKYLEQFSYFAPETKNQATERVSAFLPSDHIYRKAINVMRAQGCNIGATNG